MPVGQQPVGPGTRDKGIEQDPLQVAAVNGELRMIVTRRAAERLLVDQLAKAIEEGRIGGRDRDFGQFLLQTKPGQFLGRMRQQVDADTHGSDFGGRLEDTAGNSGIMQRKPKRQSAYAGPDDNDVVHISSLRNNLKYKTSTVSLLSIGRYRHTGYLERFLTKHMPMREVFPAAWQASPPAQPQELKLRSLSAALALPA